MSYRKIGGLHFVRVGRFGFTFYWSRKRRALRASDIQRACRRASREQRAPVQGHHGPDLDYPHSFNPYFER